MKNKFSHSIQNIQQEIAALAARMIVQEGATYRHATQRAIKQIFGALLPPRNQQPDQQQLEQAVRAYQDLFQAETSAQHLQRLRLAALDLMQRLDNFQTYLCGPVCKGGATLHTEIQLQLFVENSKELEFFLLNQGIEFKVDHPNRDPNLNPTLQALEIIHLDWQECAVQMTVYDLKSLAHLRKNAKHERANSAELRRLLVESRTTIEKNYQEG